MSHGILISGKQLHSTPSWSERLPGPLALCWLLMLSWRESGSYVGLLKSFKGEKQELEH